MDLLKDSTVRVKASSASLVKDHLDKIYNLFSVRIFELKTDDTKHSPYAYFKVEGIDSQNPSSKTVVDYVQRYLETIDKNEGCSGGGEDSSYDSEDCDEGGGRAGEEDHASVCRTASDTLAAEYADYVDSAYSARLEFSLKLGYTEPQVQAALSKLPPNPSNNELLAELIKVVAAGAGTSLGDGVLTSERTSILDQEDEHDECPLRPIVIDGSNVAISHGNKEIFSCRGIKICVDWFRARGHTEITVFVPKWRKQASTFNNPIIGQEVLYELERQRILVWTPSRLVSGKRLVCYDDRYILRLAADTGAIVVSNDNYKDLAQENVEFRRVVDYRILMYSFVNDRFMPPEDPLGRNGPTLDKFLQFGRQKTEPRCPYGRKCTYGAKCKFHHPERGSMPVKTVSERLVEHAQQHKPINQGRLLKGKSVSLPLSCEGENRNNVTIGSGVKKATLCRTRSVAVNSGFDNSVIVPSSSGSAPLRECPPQPAVLPPSSTSANNLHKKLERQLSLNPYENAVGRHDIMAHQQVARIASAPPAPSHQSPWLPADPRQARLMIYYHLVNLFPEEQVLSVMRLLPNTTNPQKICAALLTLYPPKP